MEQNIIISNLNDFIFCPRSIYFHNLYYQFDEKLYHSTFQAEGKNSHKSIDSKSYSTKKKVLEGINIYSEELGVIGKIDIFDDENKILIERKNKIKKIYDGYFLQIYAQYFCLIEMGYEIKKIRFYSISDNKRYDVTIPSDKDKEKLKKVITEIRNFSLDDKSFSQNPKKCRMCIYRQLCDYYKENDD